MKLELYDIFAEIVQIKGFYIWMKTYMCWF